MIEERKIGKAELARDVVKEPSEARSFGHAFGGRFGEAFGEPAQGSFPNPMHRDSSKPLPC